MIKGMSFNNLYEIYLKDRGKVKALLQDSKRKDLLDFIKTNNLFVYGKKQSKKNLMRSIFCWLHQYYLITKEIR